MADHCLSNINQQLHNISIKNKDESVSIDNGSLNEYCLHFTSLNKCGYQRILEIRT